MVEANDAPVVEPDAVADPAALRPRRTAALLAAGYVALCSVYILVSSRLAAVFADDERELEQFERWKGTGFVVVTGVAFYWAAATWLRRIEAQRRHLVEQQARLAAADRRALAGELAAAIAHDINNSLMVAQLHVGELRHEELSGVERAEAMEALEKSVTHIGDLARRLTQLGRGRANAPHQPLELGTTLREALELVRSHAKVRGCRLAAAIDDDLPIDGNATGIQRMIVNLVLNAAEALEGRGTIELGARREGERAVIEVHDDGPGIAPELRERIFEACFTTKSEGSGLGLTSVKAVVADHEGELALERSPLGGALFRIELPLRSTVAAPELARSPS